MRSLVIVDAAVGALEAKGGTRGAGFKKKKGRHWPSYDDSGADLKGKSGQGGHALPRGQISSTFSGVAPSPMPRENLPSLSCYGDK